MAESRNVKIKGTRAGLVIMLNPTCDVEELKRGLLRQLENARDFFRGARFTFCHGKKSLPAEYKQELLQIVVEYGLIYEENIAFPSVPKAASRDQAQKSPVEINSARDTQSENGGAQPPLPLGAGSALFVRQSLRAGQSVVTERHFVIAGDVHAGSSVTAAGSIVVLGTLSGVANAGVYGDRSAVIWSRKLAPTALSIAGVAGVPPTTPLFESKAVLKGNLLVYAPIRN